MKPADQEQRDLAAGSLERNVVVLAGAGTGKTRLLIDRLTLLLLGRAIPVEKIVALTFTKKAAEEMRVRLEERLRSVAAGEEVIDLLERRFADKKIDWPALAAKALEDMPKAQIGTIHSFAGHLLRLFPLQAAVDPSFREDQGDRTDLMFESEWASWLRDELGREAPRAPLWRELLPKVDLRDVKELAQALASPMVALDESAAPVDLRTFASNWRSELDGIVVGKPVSERAGTFNGAIAAMRGVFDAIAAGRRPDEDLIAELEGWSGEPPKTWGDDGRMRRRLRELARLTRDVASVDEDVIALTLRAVVPFVKRFRAALSGQGVMSFDGLLVFARDLVRDHPEVRRQLQKQYQVFLVDEFQDTDPLQGEILFYLSEAGGTGVRDWREVRLEPGRLFVVGDPKQSIYRFRGADIAAFEAFEAAMVRQGAIQATLSVNFRSRPGVIDGVNEIFTRVMKEQPGVQPAYAPLEAGRDGEAGAGSEMIVFSVDAAADPSAEEMREREAELIAKRIEEAVRSGAATYRDVALLFRSTNAFPAYLEALKERGIPYLAEGEKFFFQTHEVTELLNLLSAVADPRDRLALVGVLRSPVGALTDGEIFALHQAGELDFRLSPATHASKTAPVFRLLRDLHDDASRMPVPMFIRHALERARVLELFAATPQAEQAIANLFKVERLAQRWSEDGPISLKAFVRRFRRYRRDEREEAENPLADSQFDAVKVMTIHKAKGLEFPIVYLPNICADRPPAGDRPALLRSWGHAGAGLRLRRQGAINGAMLLFEQENRRRDDAEEIRVFYVAATRAREKCVFILRDEVSGSSVFAGLLQTAGAWPAAGAACLRLGKAEVPVTSVGWAAPPAGGAWRPGIEALGAEWEPGRLLTMLKERAEDLARAESGRLLTSPTALQDEPEKAPLLTGDERPAASYAADLGTLCHAVLELWDFKTPAARREAELRKKLDQALRLTEVSPEQSDGERIRADAKDILSAFMRSNAYETLAGARIVGREIPFVYPLHDSMPNGARFMNGRIDLLYERDGRLVVADYKTTQTFGRPAAAVAAGYAVQSAVYREAVSRAAGRPVDFEIIFLRTGESVIVR